MKTKVLLAALSLPLVFAACSQDEWMDDAKQNGNIKADGIKVALNVTKNCEGENGAQTRAEWDESSKAIKFESGDKISVYWLGNAATWSTANSTNPLPVNFNSVFHTTDGAAFTSESMVFLGGNVAVYPADLGVYGTAGENVMVKVAQNQTAETIKAVPYISNQLDIRKHSNKQSSQLPGYYGNAELDAPVKMAANVVNLAFNLSNIPQGYNFEVQSVELVTVDNGGAAKNAFVTEANVKTIGSTPNYEAEVEINNSPKTMKETIITETWTDPVTKVASIKTTALEGAKTASVKARFVVLPVTVNANLAADATVLTGTDKAKIVIRTNCGTITLDDGALAENAEGMVVKSNGEKTTLKRAFKEFLNATASTVSGGKFEGETIGKNFSRVIAVDASTAELNGSEVYSDADIRNYVSLYGAMGKVGAMQLVLSTDAENQPATFAGLTKSTASLIDANNNFSLVASNVAGNKVNAVEIVGGGDVYSVKNFKDTAGKVAGVNTTVQDNVALVLGEGTWNMKDVFAVAPAGSANNPLNKVVNNGTLVIEGTKTSGNQNMVAPAIANNGTIKLANSLVKMNGNLTTSKASTIELETGKELKFGAAIASGKLFGTINVASGAYLTVAGGTDVENNGVINNRGIVATEGGAGGNGLINAVTNDPSTGKKSDGTINVLSDNAVTYIKNNAYGKIYLNSRTNEVDVKVNKGDIVYKYNYSTDGAVFKQYPTDRFTLVEFGEDATAVTLHKPVTVPTSDGTINPTNTSMSFAGSTRLVVENAGGETIKNLTVKEGANMIVNTGNILNVSSLKNDGTITLGGTINYSVYGGNTGKGRVLSTGGAINYVASMVASVTGDLTVNQNATYNMTGTVTIVGVDYGVTAVLTGAQTAKVAKTVFESMPTNSYLKIGNGATLEIGANDGSDFNAGTFAEIAAGANVGTLNGDTAFLNALKNTLNPKNITLVSGTPGIIQAVFKATLTSTAKKVTATWDGSKWTVTGIADV